MAYRELSGNLFNSKADVFVNTVNCVGVMGKGVALEFKRRYPDMFQEYRRICQKRQLNPGQILPYRKQTPWILNFAIKNDWKHRSRIEWVESCLSKFVNCYRPMGIQSVAFPWMGAMNGGIPLEKIQEITRRHLSNLADISVEVYSFDKDAADPLFQKLNTIAQTTNLDIRKLSKATNIRPGYMENIIITIREGKINSLPLLIESGVIGKTNIEKLYAFLRQPSLDIDGLFRDAVLFP